MVRSKCLAKFITKLIDAMRMKIVSSFERRSLDFGVMISIWPTSLSSSRPLSGDPPSSECVFGYAVQRLRTAFESRARCEDWRGNDPHLSEAVSVGCLSTGSDTEVGGAYGAHRAFRLLWCRGALTKSVNDECTYNSTDIDFLPNAGEMLATSIFCACIPFRSRRIVLTVLLRPASVSRSSLSRASVRKKGRAGCAPALHSVGLSNQC